MLGSILGSPYLGKLPYYITYHTHYYNVRSSMVCSIIHPYIAATRPGAAPCVDPMKLLSS